MEKQTWRETILDQLDEEGELSADSLHEAAEDEADLEEAEAALAALVAEGAVREAGPMTYVRA